MTKHDLDNAQELVSLVQELTQDEGDAVTFIHDNPDDGHNCGICVQVGFRHLGYYYGETVIDCLEQAKESRQ